MATKNNARAYMIVLHLNTRNAKARRPMENKSDKSTPNFLTRLGNHCAGPLAAVALSGTSTWMIITGIKGLAGFTVNTRTALADLVGIVIVIGLARWMKIKFDAK